MSNPTAKQIQFRESMRDLGCCVSSEDWHVQMHHVVGRSAKVKGVGNIGHWFVIPLAWRYHDVNSNDDLNVTHNKNAFEDKFGTQASLFKQKLEMLKAKFGDDAKFLPPTDVVEEIMGYRR